MYNAMRTNMDDRKQGAINQGLELFDLTEEIWIERGWTARVKELKAARNEFVISVESDHPDDSLERYFNQFAYAARNRRERQIT